MRTWHGGAREHELSVMEAIAAILGHPKELVPEESCGKAEGMRGDRREDTVVTRREWRTVVGGWLNKNSCLCFSH